MVFLNIFDDPLKKILKRAKKYVILIRLLFQLKSNKLPDPQISLKLNESAKGIYFYQKYEHFISITDVISIITC